MHVKNTALGYKKQQYFFLSKAKTLPVTYLRVIFNLFELFDHSGAIGFPIFHNPSQYFIHSSWLNNDNESMSQLIPSTNARYIVCESLEQVDYFFLYQIRAGDLNAMLEHVQNVVGILHTSRVFKSFT